MKLGFVCGAAIAAILPFVATVGADAQPAPVPSTAAQPEKPAAAAVEAAPAPPAAWGSSGWTDTVVVSAQAEAGLTLDLSGSSGDGRNFGVLTTDYNNAPLFNQLFLTVSRAIDPKQTEFDIGFKLQGLYGTDARYTHSLGVFSRALDNRAQFDVFEADVSFHLPFLGANGTDLKVGLYPTPLGVETTDPSQTFFYSHNYTYNFGVPVKHAGGYAVTHVNDVFDLYAGVDTGNSTTFGNGEGDNNGAAAGLGGFGLNLLGGKLAVLALTHIGAENSTVNTVNASSYLRYYNDVAITYKPSSTLTWITELNFARDDVIGANAFGITETLAYAISPTLSFAARAEVFRDDNGFFVAQYPRNLDPVLLLRGLPSTAVGIGQATYGEATIGFQYKPPVASPLALVAIRPEIRVDHNFVDKGTFNGFRDRTSVTLAADVIVGF